MAKETKKTYTAPVLEEVEAASGEKKYIVAQGHAFTSGGVIYAEGDSITVAAFADKADFDRAVKAGKIIEKPAETTAKSSAEGAAAENPAGGGGSENSDGGDGKTPDGGAAE